MLRHVTLVPLLVIPALLACGTAQPAQQQPARTVGLSLKEATALVAAFEAKQVPASHKPATVSSKEEALTALKSDRIDMFPSAVEWLDKQEGVEMTALKAQTLLAWGEAEITVAEVLARTADRLDENVRSLQVRKLNEADTQKLEAERARVQLYRDTDQALRLLAAEHVGAGIEAAKKVIAEKPDDYVGYRVAADAHRLRSEWKDFSAMVTKVEEKNPDSNGLVFLRGVAAQMRDGDATEAVKLYRQALEKDPNFVRAQAQLVLVQTNIFEQKKELDKLKAIAPDHQIVRWAGPGLEQAHKAALERQEAIQTALQTRPGPQGRQQQVQGQP
jgi:tetratricopeptide (TPR) repeat protein